VHEIAKLVFQSITRAILGPTISNCCYSWSWQTATFRTQSLLRYALTVVLTTNLLHFLQWWPMLNATAVFMPPPHQPDPSAEHPASFGVSPTSTYSLITFWHMLRGSCAKNVPYMLNLVRGISPSSVSRGNIGLFKCCQQRAGRQRTASMQGCLILMGLQQHRHLQDGILWSSSQCSVYTAGCCMCLLRWGCCTELW